MLYPGFISGSYESQSPLADLERTVNWYPEPIEPRSVPWESALYPCPGFEEYVTLSNVNTRALFSMGGRVYGVIGDSVYKFTASHSATVVTDGTVTNNPNPAQIASNGDAGGELLIASGENGYLLNIASNTLSAISALSGKCTMAGMIDGYFLSFDASDSKFYISELNDGTTWDATQIAQRTAGSDPWQAMVVAHRDIWLFGTQTTEVWYNAGTSPFPFAPIPGAFLEEGIVAPFSAQRFGNTVVWLGRSEEGAGVVYMANGYAPQRISTHAVEFAIQGYARAGMTISDAVAFTYQEDGHVFYVLNFPSAKATWVFDGTTQLWHERGTWNATEQSEVAPRREARFSSPVYCSH